MASPAALASVLDGQEASPRIFGVMPSAVMGQGDPSTGYYPTRYAVPGQPAASDRAAGVMASLLTAPARAIFGLGQGIGRTLDQANQAMPWGGNNPQAIGLDPQMGTMDPSVMVPFATDVAGMAATGGVASPKPAGALGIFGGRLAKTADLDALARAEKMAAEGVDRASIWNETGWFQGVDGKWRFEIPDNAAATTEQAWKGSIAPLGQNMEHSALYESYPQMADIPSVMGPGRQSMRGSFQGDDDFSMLTARGPTPYDLTGTALHEAQHAVQQAESTARGGNTMSLWSHSDPAVRKAVHAEWRRLMAPVSREEFEKGYSIGWSPSKAQVDEAYADYLKSNKKARGDVYDIANKAAQETAATNVYRRLAGEVEARNVQTRMNMTPEDRRATPPWATQDVPDEYQIIRMPPTYTTGGRF